MKPSLHPQGGGVSVGREQVIVINCNSTSYIRTRTLQTRQISRNKSPWRFLRVQFAFYRVRVLGCDSRIARSCIRRGPRWKHTINNNENTHARREEARPRPTPITIERNDRAELIIALRLQRESERVPSPSPSPFSSFSRTRALH